MKITTTGILGIICIILLGFGLFFYFKAKSKDNNLQNQQNLVSALTDSINIVRNKDSSTTATIQTFAITNSDLLQQINSKDSTILRLQNLQKQYSSKLTSGGSITSISANTNINQSVVNVTTSKDTVRKDSLIYIYPEYRANINLGKWITGFSLANKDSTYYNINVYNEFDAIIYKEKGQWQVDAIMHNPYSETKSIRALNVTAPKINRFGIDIFGGYGAGYTDKQVKLLPMIGIGLGYHLINF